MATIRALVVHGYNNSDNKVTSIALQCTVGRKRCQEPFWGVKRCPVRVSAMVRRRLLREFFDE